MDIIAYTYKADIYCPECISDQVYNENLEQMPAFLVCNDAETDLDYFASILGIDRSDEYTFDSGDFPKVVFKDQLRDWDWCGKCNQKINKRRR